MAAQPPQLGGEQGTAVERLGRVRRLAGRLDGVAQRGQLGGVDAVGDLQELVGDRGRLRASAYAGDVGGAQGEQPQVARPDRPARPGEQGEHRRVGRDVVEEGQGGDHLGHLREADEAGQADDLDRDACRGEGVVDLLGLGVVAAQHAHVGPGGARVVLPLDGGGQPGQLVDGTLVDVGLHAPLAGDVGGPEPCHLVAVGREQRLGEPVGDVEDAAVGAPVDRQRQPPRLAVRGGERVGEVEDVGHRGAAPAVDGLVGVTDRHDGVAQAVVGIGPGEEPGQHGGLGDGGVLVFIQQHDLEARALQLADLGLVVDEPGGQGDLVTEVHQPQVGLEPAVAADELEQLGPPVDGVDRLGRTLEVGLACLAGLLLLDRALEPSTGLGVDAAYGVLVDEVLAHRAVEGEEVLDGGGGVVGQQLDVAGEALDDAGAELVAGGVGDDPGVGLVADAQAVVGEQGGGVGVVGRDGGLEHVLPLHDDRAVEQPGGTERGGHPVAQLGGGLGGEGEAEHLLGPHLARGHQPHDPLRHQRGLAAAGAGHHDRGSQR